MTHFSWSVDGSTVGLYLLATMVAGIVTYLIAGAAMVIGSLLKPRE